MMQPVNVISWGSGAGAAFAAFECFGVELLELVCAPTSAVHPMSIATTTGNPARFMAYVLLILRNAARHRARRVPVLIRGLQLPARTS
jgi:hypothetical protein